MYFLYSAIFTLGTLLAAPFYLRRYRGSGFLRQSLPERFGRLPASFKQPVQSAIWVHAVSVGETLAARGLLQELQRLDPDRKIFISHVTPTGRAIGEKTLPGLAGRFYLPLDWSIAVRQALDCLRPKLLLILETELWPNLLREAHRSGAQVVLANARLSDRSFRGYRLARPFMHRVLEDVDWIFAQTEADAERFRRIGARPERVLAMGNLKFDAPPPGQSEFAIRLHHALAGLQRPVLIAASTMPGEEELVLEAWTTIRARHPNALLILAPRHPPRFEQVARLAEGQSGAVIRRTALDAGRLAPALAGAEILVLDTIGELAGLFSSADVVFMGGSLVPTGGHNLLEPAQAGKPVIFGPHMQNFRDAAAIFLDAGAAIQVANREALAEEVSRLFGDAERRREIGLAARRAVESGSGATARIASRLAELLGSESAAAAPASWRQFRS